MDYKTLLILTFLITTANHPVDLPELEQSEIWRKCCEHSDCVVHDVQILDMDTDTASIVIDGVGFYSGKVRGCTHTRKMITELDETLTQIWREHELDFIIVRREVTSG